LIAIEPVVPTAGDKKQLNVYDGQSRRVRKQVSTYASGSWSLTTDEKFIYDGWNVVAVLDVSSPSPFALSRTYTWGSDLSGSMQGAGGVGGLLSTKDGSSVYHYTYDANGNVSEVLNSSGGIAAHYEYDTFGNAVASSGTYATANAYRFSTKPLDSVSELYYYGFRYYNPGTGRWLSRDPIEEWGGVNIYGFVRNNSLNWFDYMGLEIKVDYTPPDPTQIAPEDVPDGGASGTEYFDRVLDIDATNCKLTAKISFKARITVSAKQAKEEGTTIAGIYGHEQRHVLSRSERVRLNVVDKLKLEKSDYTDPEECKRAARTLKNKYMGIFITYTDNKLSQDHRNRYDDNEHTPENRRPYRPLPNSVIDGPI
jgi:RHS repeat-associated protein